MNNLQKVGMKTDWIMHALVRLPGYEHGESRGIGKSREQANMRNIKIASHINITHAIRNTNHIRI